METVSRSDGRISLYVSVRTSVRRVGLLLRSHAPGQQERQSYGPNKSQRFHRHVPRRGIIHGASLTIGKSGGWALYRRPVSPRTIEPSE